MNNNETSSNTPENVEEHVNITYNISEVKDKLIDFSEYLVGQGRLQLLHANKTECEEFIFLILNMNKALKAILTELGKTWKNKEYNFKCSVCDEELIIPHANFWDILQNHEHVEEVYNNILQGVVIPKILDEVVPSTSVEDISLALNKSVQLSQDDIEQFSECDENITDISEDEQIFNEDNPNGFRFNFVPSYDNSVQSVLYPEKSIKSLRKYDATKYPTILLIGPNRAVCLLCPCDLVSRSKIRPGRHFLDHIVGNKHMKQADLPENVNAVINFHETWLSREPALQAHQVYFMPCGDYRLRCVLCGVYVDSCKVDIHILSDLHKINVLVEADRKITCYHLLNMQVEVYGLIWVAQPTNKPPAQKVLSKIKEPTKKTNQNKSNKKTEDTLKTKDVADVSPHNIIKSIANTSSNKAAEFLPNRFINHSLFFIKVDNKISCRVCQIRFPFDVLKIVNHICDKSHLELSGVGLNTYSYYCEVCNLRILNENAWMKHYADISKLHAKLPESRKRKTTEYECTKCSTVIFGDELSLTRHLSTKRAGRTSNEIKLAPAVLKLFKNKMTLESEAALLLEQANETLLSNGATMACCNSIEDHLATTFEGCKVFPFGSRISGLGNQNSDLDIFLDTGNMYTGNNNQDSKSQILILKKVYGILIKAKDDFQDLFQIPTARTPIVKFHHKKTKIDCDISFRHGLSVENTKFLRFCFDIQPIAQQLILVLKMWSQHNNLYEHITTYALAIMAIFFLQTKCLLLSVKTLRHFNDDKSLTICGWETIKYSASLETMKKQIISYSGALVALLKDFFGFYAKFLYQVDVVCPLLGHCIKKTDFDNNGKHLPPEMNSYRAQLHSDEPEAFRNASPMCVQDPFDLSHNLTKALQPGTLNRWKTLCELSYKHLDTL